MTTNFLAKIHSRGCGAVRNFRQKIRLCQRGCRMSDPVLIGDAMTGGYGAVDILHAARLPWNRGQIAVIVGPNGAGKSTAMKAVFGMLKLRGGQVRLKARISPRCRPQARVAKGMAFVPQTQNIFTSMTVEENLEMGAFLRRDDIKPDAGAGL
jgi:branched-chain amino acid transport system ATP-binding protein